jgi:hypothetical protein
MNSPFGTWYRLAPRSQAGLCCDRAGVALGPITLIAPRQGRYRLRSVKEIAEAFAIAYGPKPPKIFTRWHAGLDRVAKALDQGRDALAAIAAVQTGFPAIVPEVMAKLALSLSPLAKVFNPDEPRLPAGDPAGGEWTGDGSVGVQIAEDGGLQSDAPKYSPYVKMTTRQVGNIIFNETRSLSGPDIDDARNAIAHVIRNGKRHAERTVLSLPVRTSIMYLREKRIRIKPVKIPRPKLMASVVKGSIQPAAQLIST